MALVDPSKTPLVSVAVLLRKDQRLVARVLRSVLAQDYPALECIVVDCGTGQADAAVEGASIAGDPRWRLVTLAEDTGKPGALFEIIHRIGGDFICVLDADEVLTESFVSAHVEAHLSLGKTVAFTSSEIGSLGVNGQGDPVDGSLPPPADQAGARQRLDGRLSVIPSWQACDFPTNMATLYRREALRIASRWRSRTIDRSGDHYLRPFCHALGGSATIDLILSSREFDAVARPASDRLTAAEALQLAKETVQLMLRDSGFFRDWFGEAGYWDAVQQVAEMIAGLGLDRSPLIANAIIRHLDNLRQTFDHRALALHLSGRFPLIAFARLLATAPAGGRDRMDFALRLVKYAFRRRSASWLRRKLRRPGLTPPAWRPPEPDGPLPRDYGPIALLAGDPPIFKTGMAHLEWVGIAGAFGRRFGNSPAGFLVYPTWSVEEPARMAALGAAARQHARRYPSHRLIYMCNTQYETDLVRREGLRSIFLNKNFTVSDTIFRLLSDVTPRFDAVYNARFSPGKRHYLAANIERLAYLGYLVGTDEQQAEQMALLDRVLAEHPGHVLLNPKSGGSLRRFSPEDTNRCLNQARVGLCLSAVEGSNYASMEYMLAGLGVVSTPSSGGRDVYFDPDFCIICEPDADAVRRAVAELVGRNIPREHIRSRTLERINVERERFLNLVSDLGIELGSAPRRVSAWPYGAVSGVIRWDRYDTYLETLEQTLPALDHRAHAACAIQLLAANLAEIQLQPAELIPILRAIASAPHCRLLIFGCGKDSRLWESVNRDGITVFVEDDEDWVAETRRELSDATVVEVNYGTRVAEWPALLGADDRLTLHLPPTVAGMKWDVIFVDGPAGYSDDQPGRMKSIYTAAQLVAPGGKVFVHDCERPLEREYAARYLGDQRRFTSVTGRALLNGYAF